MSFGNDQGFNKFEVETAGSNAGGLCDCCGKETKTVWGYIHEPERTLCAYYCSWTVDTISDGLAIDLLIGEWGDNTTSLDRATVGLLYKLEEENRGVYLLDVPAIGATYDKLAASHLSRQEVYDKGKSRFVFSLVDEILLHDPRLQEILSLMTNEGET